MKRMALVFALIASLLTGTVAIAAVKSGASCSKAGATSIATGKKYTCVKSGKKLVWDKGTTIKKPAVVVPEIPKPEPTSSPNSSTSNTQQQTNLEGASCKKQGDQIKDSSGLLECRPIIGNKLQLIRLQNNFQPISNSSSPEQIQTCQLADARGANKQWTSIGYPATPIRGFRNSGVEKIVVAGIDFSDSPGNGKPSDIWKSDLMNAQAWINWYSNGKLKLEFAISDKWSRAPKTSDNYEVGDHSEQKSNLSNEQIKEDLIRAIEPDVDLSNTSAIWIYYPENIQQINGLYANRQTLVKTKYGDVISDLYATGKFIYKSKFSIWTHFIHEMMHAQGIMGHSPRSPFRIGLMFNPSSESVNLNGWDQLALDWLKTGEYYCAKASNLETATLKLVPIEREQDGLTTVLIKLSETKIIVIESHREDRWSQALGAGFYGVMVYVVDTTFNAQWSGDEAPGTYLKVKGANHGLHVPMGTPIEGADFFGIGVVNGIGISGGLFQWDLNYVMYLGESITYEGVKISLVSTGDNDTVEISRVS